jgi:hypothetical protein
MTDPPDHHPNDNLIRQRITITLDIIDQPGNDSIAINALHHLVRQLEHDANFPNLIRLEISPPPTPRHQPSTPKPAEPPPPNPAKA